MTTLADLSPRQIAVAALVAKAKPVKVIAAELGMSVRRVQAHIAAIADTCRFDPSCSLRIQLALWYREQVPVCLPTLSGVHISDPARSAVPV